MDITNTLTQPFCSYEFSSHLQLDVSDSAEVNCAKGLDVQLETSLGKTSQSFKQILEASQMHWQHADNKRRETLKSCEPVHDKMFEPFVHSL